MSGLCSMRFGFGFLDRVYDRIFQNPVIRAQWKDEITSKITIQGSKFVALHFQETGGKDYKKYSKDVVVVIYDLFSILKEKGFSSLRAYLDIDYERIDEFTVSFSLTLH